MDARLGVHAHSPAEDVVYLEERSCNGVQQAVYCNKQPCNFNFCCQPFYYVNQGYCFSPYYTDTVIDEEERLKLFGEYENNFSGEGSGELEGSGQSEGSGLIEGSGF
ncbi:unnamed protein product [Cylicostephanus goldi]|uniref:Uncharacterized protein n=1 Tax=Cylicostephanus goldi TaxID=71465 RepID=A0A3P6UJ71_CYLGO|nr:unnamed protein product [Cylicostephanus goldi]